MRSIKKQNKNTIAILFLHWQHNWHPYRQLATYAFSCTYISVSNAVLSDVTSVL